ncbi:TIGR01440 family protein [Enterococcus cecorum]|uniref:TIGR01440 family protein n=1 Tax=Enterococcus cecorum TaxID=44008 RepID=UPI001FAD18DC|nr:TIGR01440 family protein [Enterococcus cecorum]MCJ0538414.1 TIGR01440 family protein [Enterococcus cecorum]MCJ0545217.1 TIGR01440 family protein [Enterococcus cecorum]MCJ0550153.1 TIGR01440 family protein [Enterococcus cecorum]MCJ0568272.1 TIGR01440 family protein [Enterococcus cecorum]
MIEKEQLIRDLTTITQEVLAKAQLKAGDIFVLGCSTSEIAGGVIGKNSSQEIGEWVVETLLAILSEQKIFLAVQGCEHLNRALVVERAAQERYNLEEVAVVPQLHAGGACSVAAFRYFNEPVEVEHLVAKAGIDLGDTSIGMHIKHVQVPIRPSIRELGGAHVTALYSRPKYIGGPRAKYE